MALIVDSYHLMIVGSLLQSISLFMLSLAKPEQFYLVSSARNLTDWLPEYVATRFLLPRVSFLGVGWV